ncbi:hypothetical protein pb186bvf_015599 [Paramecium bursaria]
MEFVIKEALKFLIKPTKSEERLQQLANIPNLPYFNYNRPLQILELHPKVIKTKDELHNAHKLSKMKYYDEDKEHLDKMQKIYSIILIKPVKIKQQDPEEALKKNCQQDFSLMKAIEI